MVLAMIDPVVIDAQHAARQSLIEYAAMVGTRDQRIVTAYRAGLQVSEIARLAGHTRETVYKAIGAAGEHPSNEGNDA
jgi:transposase-like protein